MSIETPWCGRTSAQARKEPVFVAPTRQPLAFRLFARADGSIAAYGVRPTNWAGLKSQNEHVQGSPWHPARPHMKMSIARISLLRPGVDGHVRFREQRNPLCLLLEGVASRLEEYF